MPSVPATVTDDEVENLAVLATRLKTRSVSDAVARALRMLDLEHLSRVDIGLQRELHGITHSTSYYLPAWEIDHLERLHAISRLSKSQIIAAAIYNAHWELDHGGK